MICYITISQRFACGTPPATYQETLASSYRVFKVSSLNAKEIIRKVQNILLTIVLVFSMNANTLIPVHRWEK